MSSLMVMALMLAAPQPPDRCIDDRGQDRCLAAAQERLRDLYGLKPIEVLAANRAIVRRTLYVDGYGRDLVAIEFIRAPGSDPMVRVMTPRPASKPSPRMEAPVAASRWAAVIDGSRHFERRFAPLEGPVEPNICLHSWVYTVEAADPGARPSPVRAVTRDACDDSPAAQFASLAAKEALAAFEPCSALDRRHYRNEASMLATCFRLGGDRLAAAGLLNRVEGLAGLSGQARTALDKQTYYRVAVEWDGQSASGSAGKALIDAKLAEAGRTDLTIIELRGHSERAGSASGRLDRASADGKGPGQSADVTLQWDLQWAQPVTAVKVGPWRASDRR